MSRATRLFPGSPRQTSKLFSLCNERHLCCLWLNGLPICQDLSSSCPVVLHPSPVTRRRCAILSLSVFSLLSPLLSSPLLPPSCPLLLISLSDVLFLPPSSSLPSRSLLSTPTYPIAPRTVQPRMSLTHRTRACSGRESRARPIGCGSVCRCQIRAST